MGSKGSKDEADEKSEDEGNKQKKDRKGNLIDSLKNMKGPKIQNIFSKNKKDEKDGSSKEESEKLLNKNPDEEKSAEKDTDNSDNCFMTQLRHVARSVPSRLKRDGKMEKIPSDEEESASLLKEKNRSKE